MKPSTINTEEPQSAKAVLQQIRAGVSPALLKNTHLLFNQSRYTTFHELLQNCRRAQATQVDIQILPCGENTSKVKITDNGIGIENPEKLLILGDSDWDASTKGRETPAGMGFFSLCHLSDGVEVQSRTWRMHITKESFLGSTEVDLLCAPELTGTSLSFQYPEKAEILQDTVRGCAHHYPVPVKLNGVACHQEGFTDRCLYQLQVEGAIIGITTGNPSEGLNFHGLTMFKSKKDSEAFILPSSIATAGFVARVEIQDNRILDLVLPARNAVVQNSKWETLKAHCRRAVYLTIQALKMEHTLAFEDYLEAKIMGINLPEATPCMKRTYQRSVNSYLSFYPFEEDGHEYEIDPTTRKVAITPISESETLAYFMANALLTKEGKPSLPILVQEDKTKKGYSWYPKNEVLSVDFKVSHQGQTFSWNPAEGKPKDVVLGTCPENRPESIQLEISFQKGGMETLVLQSPIGFWENENDDPGYDCAWTLTKEIKSEGEIPFDLEKLFLALYFSESDDSESDSYETQKQDFTTQMQETMACIFGNPEEWALQKLQEAIESYKLRGTLDLGKIQEFKVTRNEKGEAEIEILRRFET